ncbi:hypothetical protein GGS23DRAFT_616916 [Durotheca rogersii]|uniref:uncharacterized protein n=1 Tax=Durotheca rogersii TaxID=419775 RepID=UPI0022212857|nr:uncharacterized protein GGS23DRAFT_616916 [Durotheca rogersii]KAI5865801.1 hypothetical protein GGS23DRAFT_616916 [Durotheca rogersii]
MVIHATGGSFDFLGSCCFCIPWKPWKSRAPSPPNSPAYRSKRYNAQVRTNLNLPARPIELLTRTRLDESTGNSEAGSQTMLLGEHRRPVSRPVAPVPSLPPSTLSRAPGSTGTRRSNGSATKNPPRWSTEPLDDAQLTELFDAIHATLAHVPYAICGLAALADHGFTERRVRRGISLLCPAHSKNNVRAWLAASGYGTADEYADSVGIPIRTRRAVEAAQRKGKGKKKARPGQDAEEEGDDSEAETEMRRVRIKYLEEGFESLELVRSCHSQAWVLSLTSQLDHVAAGFVDHHRRLQAVRAAAGRSRGGSSRYGGKGGRSRSNSAWKEKERLDREREKEERALATIAGDVFWCLNKAASARAPLSPARLPTLLGEAFWTPFTATYGAAARPALARAGIDVAGVLARHREEAAVREHEEMLRRYMDGGDGGQEREVRGLGGRPVGAATPSPPFEGMRTLLADKRSVYTLRDTRDFSGYNFSPVSPVFVPYTNPLGGLPSVRLGPQQEEEEEEEEQGKQSPDLEYESEPEPAPESEPQQSQDEGSMEEKDRRDGARAKPVNRLIRKWNSLRDVGGDTAAAAATKSSPLDQGRSLTRNRNTWDPSRGGENSRPRF